MDRPDEYGTILEVSTTNQGTAFAASAIIGATVITLADVTIFEELGGQVYIDGNTYYYTAVDHTTNTMTLLTGLLTAATADETQVEIYPPAPVRTAMVAFGVAESEAVRVTIPHFFAGMPDGVRTADAREVALVEERNPGELYLRDVMSKGMILLAPGDNLDDYIATGNFVQLFSADAAGGTNYPVPYAGVLEVLSTRPSNLIVQRYTAYRNVQVTNTPSVWVRAYGNAVWSAWMPDQDDTGWVTTVADVAVALTGWTIESAAVRRVNKQVHFRIWVDRSGADITVPVHGDFDPDSPVFQFVTAWRPGGSVVQSVVAGGAGKLIAGVIGTDGTFTLTAVQPGSNISANFAIAGTYLMA